jgi:hypothetical protein
VRDKTYNLLISKLNKNRGKPRDAYTDEEIRTILTVTQLEGDGIIFKACLLMCLSGLSIGACQRITFESMKQIKDDVWVFPVTSKGRTYVAAISNYGHDLLVQFSWIKTLEVVPYSEYNYKTPFQNLFRNKLRYILLQKGFRTSLKGKSIQNSMRRWAIHKWATTLHPDDVALLAGHVVSASTAYRYYVNKNKEKVVLNYERKIAECYSQTPLMSWRLDEDNKVANKKI